MCVLTILSACGGSSEPDPQAFIEEVRERSAPVVKGLDLGYFDDYTDGEILDLGNLACDMLTVAYSTLPENHEPGDKVRAREAIIFERSGSIADFLAWRDIVRSAGHLCPNN